MAPTEPQDLPPQGGSGIFPLGKSGYVSPQDKRIIPGGYGSDIPPLARNDATLRLMKQIEEDISLQGGSTLLPTPPSFSNGQCDDTTLRLMRYIEELHLAGFSGAEVAVQLRTLAAMSLDERLIGEEWR